MAEWFTIEVFDGATSARSWFDTHGDNLVLAGLWHGALDWHRQHHRWGSIFEVAFADEQSFDDWRRSALVEAALDGVPDRVNGLSIRRGRGGASGTRWPRKPRPIIGSGAVGLPIPSFFEDLYPIEAPRQKVLAIR